MTVLLDTLPNGFRVVTERMPGVASASLGVWVDAGSRHESEAENGIAHFLEHMAFKGTRRRNARAIAEQIEDVGGYLNAYTSRERTAYYARVLSADVPLAMDIIADILRDSQMAESDIEVERHVILQEIGQALDTPDDIIFDWLQETAFPEQPMGRAILGPAERVRDFCRSDLQSFIGGHYHPGRMILAAAGDVDHGQILRMAKALYGDMPAVAGIAPEPARFSGGEHRVVKPLEQAHVALALPGPSFLDADYYAAQIVSVALGGGMSSRLFQEARENRGLCYTIFAQCAAWSYGNGKRLGSGGAVGVAACRMGTGAVTGRDHREHRGGGCETGTNHRGKTGAIGSGTGFVRSGRARRAGWSLRHAACGLIRCSIGAPAAKAQSRPSD